MHEHQAHGYRIELLLNVNNCYYIRLYSVLFYSILYSSSSRSNSGSGDGSSSSSTSMESWWMRGPLCVGLTHSNDDEMCVHKKRLYEIHGIWYFIYMKLIARALHYIFQKALKRLSVYRGESYESCTVVCLLLVFWGNKKVRAF